MSIRANKIWLQRPMSRRFSFLALLLICIEAHGAEPLPKLGADAGNVTVSGFSSAGYLPVQLHVAHSALVKGAGIVAAGPYYCAQGDLWRAYYNCKDPGAFVPLPQIAVLRAEAEAQATAGRIAAPSHLASSRVWLFAGSKDREVSRDVVEALNGFYAAYKAKTLIVRDKPAGH